MRSCSHCICYFAGFILLTGFCMPLLAQDGYESIGFADGNIEVNGFLEVRDGERIRQDPNEPKRLTMRETRLQLEFNRSFDWGEMKIKSDYQHDWGLGKNELNLREANIFFTPFEFVDIKIGRQIITWGTGDLIFINDLFPKDWVSFFIGRDDEYLKIPADALKFTFYSDQVNLDIVYLPRFESDRFTTGKRLSYWNQALGRKAGWGEQLVAEDRDDWLRDDEMAIRLFRNIRGWELALYGYRGFWKNPGGLDLAENKLTFPRMNAYGGSIRGNIGGGVVSVEMGYVNSLDDRIGDNPLVNNSEFRLLAGFEKEFARDFKVGLQYYRQRMIQHDDYLTTLSPSAHAIDEFTPLYALRLTKSLLNQDLRLSLFVYYLPGDRDGYLRSTGHYRISDRCSVELGANIFAAAQEYAFFGQYRDNTNIYLGLRYSF